MNSPTSSRTSRKAVSLSQVFYKNAVYFPNYRLYNGDTPGALNFSCISTVYYSFANVALDGGVYVSEMPASGDSRHGLTLVIQLSDEYADLQAPCDGVSGGLGSLMHLKQKHPHLQVILSIGGSASSQAFSTVAASAVLRDNFARSARGLVEASGLDGIDNPQEGAGFLALLAAVRLYLPEEHYLLTAALPASCPILANIDLRRAADYLDLLNLVAYDFYGPWSPRSGHHAQLYPSSKDDDTSVSSTVSYLLSQGFPAQKTLLGIPLFGRSFVAVPGPGHRSKGSAPGSNGDGTFDYSQLPRRGTKEQLDKRACAAFCVGGDGGFVSYDNPDTVKQKAAFCRQKGLGGMFYWTGPADAKDSKRSLIAAGFRALHSS
ncbi:hypothetical protein VMCG_03485 [Cytospora schulzeri]|uniref:chitinase n=1 Tax=Cytospora schulzeri TaxID=448051 RepID=A0A423WWM0_9PEZI|nr:hypothetical protein VMCG_03485 [Valsa malicola]